MSDVKDFLIAILVSLAFDWMINSPGAETITVRAWIGLLAFWMAWKLITRIVEEIVDAARHKQDDDSRAT